MAMAVACFGGNLQAAEAESPKTVEKKVEQPTAQIRIALLAPPSNVELPGRYRVVFRISNLTDTSYMLRTLELVPFNIIDGFVGKSACIFKDQVIGVGEDSLVPCDIGSDWSVGNFGWGLLTIQPGTYSAHATSTLQAKQDGGFDGKTVAISTIVELQVRPSVWQVVIGAALGSLLLAIFVQLSPLTKFRAIDAEGGLWSFFLLWISAFVASAMFILLTYRLRETGSPITITVNDFYGGVAIGMFGILLADWLGARLFKAQDEGTPDGSKPGPEIPEPQDPAVPVVPGVPVVPVAAADPLPQPVYPSPEARDDPPAPVPNPPVR